ncbi:MAG TPA: Mov34/MPN/PAD-1 family protein [Dehalococcoidia bacterium]|nr:Mov34/MPN/PAD-1 family protein [Dehalococcoidia bacterium]
MGNVGYRYFTDHGLVGEPGLYYDYIVGGNGLFIRAGNRFINATVCIGHAKIRGLQPIRPLVVLKQGKIPWGIYHEAIRILMADALCEHYLAVVWTDGYQLVHPQQLGTEASCMYERVPDTVMEIHSHGLMSPFFSGIDNADEQSMAIYAVVGGLDRFIPDVNLRIGLYGYYDRLNHNEVFGDVQAVK